MSKNRPSAMLFHSSMSCAAFSFEVCCGFFSACEPRHEKTEPRLSTVLPVHSPVNPPPSPITRRKSLGTVTGVPESDFDVSAEWQEIIVRTDTRQHIKTTLEKAGRNPLEIRTVSLKLEKVEGTTILILPRVGITIKSNMGIDEGKNSCTCYRQLNHASSRLTILLHRLFSKYDLRDLADPVFELRANCVILLAPVTKSIALVGAISERCKQPAYPHCVFDEKNRLPSCMRHAAYAPGRLTIAVHHISIPAEH